MDSLHGKLTFNGTGDIQVFLTKVEIQSSLKGYTEEKLAQAIASRLEGPAFDVYLRMSSEDREKTAFSVPCGTFEFTVTPYGLCNAGALYQRLMDICLSGLPADRVLAYMDDIVIFTPTFNTHLHQLRTVFIRLHSAGITLKASKCVIAHQKVDFLGYVLPANGIQPQQRLTNAIRDFPCPSTKKELRDSLDLQGFIASLSNTLQKSVSH